MIHILLYKKRLEISTFVYFANTFALKAVSSTQGIRGSWNPNSKARFIDTHLQSRPALTWFEVGPAQSMHWLHCWEQLAWGPLVSRSLDIAWRQFPSLGGGMEPDSSWERASHKLRPTSPFDALSRKEGQTSRWCVVDRIHSFYRAGVDWIYILSILIEV